eukprot:PhM_4_TR9743/c0_g1_i2/m.99992
MDGDGFEDSHFHRGGFAQFQISGLAHDHKKTRESFYSRVRDFCTRHLGMPEISAMVVDELIRVTSYRDPTTNMPTYHFCQQEAIAVTWHLFLEGRWQNQQHQAPSTPMSDSPVDVSPFGDDASSMSFSFTDDTFYATNNNNETDKVSTGSSVGGDFFRSFCATFSIRPWLIAQWYNYLYSSRMVPTSGVVPDGSSFTYIDGPLVTRDAVQRSEAEVLKEVEDLLSVGSHFHEVLQKTLPANMSSDTQLSHSLEHILENAKLLCRLKLVPLTIPAAEIVVIAAMDQTAFKGMRLRQSIWMQWVDTFSTFNSRQSSLYRVLESIVSNASRRFPFGYRIRRVAALRLCFGTLLRHWDNPFGLANPLGRGKRGRADAADAESDGEPHV